ncbi:WSC domain-containing protein 2 [Marmota marmota marmota]|uniref:WSC domain-containing protein 2 n=1 Tax=Marmota marmota marmota TaxID=9994 RepID=UPI002091EB2D|nr:WSC domain-containing protein 2 [Marmota marmota marmota]
MAKLWVKVQRSCRRKPLRFLSLLALYLAAGSLVFLHSGFGGQPAASQGQASPAAGGVQGHELPFLGDLHLGRGFRDSEASSIARRYGPSFKGKDANERAKLGDYGGAWSRALKGRVLREKEEERAKYIGCYLDDTQSRALRGVSFFDYKKMTVFRCQDNCAERGYLYAGLEFGAECYCGHKIQAANVSEAECDMECKGERGSVCGGANRLSVYRLQLAQESARRYGSAVFRGCFHRPENLSLALPVTAAMPNMSVDKCVDLCTEKEFPLAALAGTACHCGFPTTRFPLHEREDERLCAQKCSAEELETVTCRHRGLQPGTPGCAPERRRGAGSAGDRPEAAVTTASGVSGGDRSPRSCDSQGPSRQEAAERDRQSLPWRRAGGAPGCGRACHSGPGSQDNRCMDRRFLPARSKQLIALASFPGAGNTWARHLIELATGFYTGSYYFDGSLYNKGFKGERDHWRSGRTICIKTHESGQKEIEAFDAAILLIRNPYKALMAEFNRKYGGHIGFAAHAHWKGKEWPEFVRNYAPWWATHTLDWLKFGKKVLVVHFEDLKQDLFVQLGRMVRLLGVAVREDRLLCVESQKDGNFKRSGLRKLEFDPYTADMQRSISAYIKMVDAALKGRNLTGVPDDYYPR